MPALYNMTTNSGEYVITKFTPDYKVEGRYVVSAQGCDCPAGSKPTCRHRKMLPMFLKDRHIGDGYFLDWDTRLWWQPKTGEVADAVRELADQLSLPAGVEVVSLDDPVKLHNAIAAAVGEPPLPAASLTPQPPLAAGPPAAPESLPQSVAGAGGEVRRRRL